MIVTQVNTCFLHKQERLSGNIPFCITGQGPNFSVLKSCLKMEAFKAFKMFSGLNNLVVWPVKYLIILTTQDGVRNRYLVRLIPHIGV